MDAHLFFTSRAARSGLLRPPVPGQTARRETLFDAPAAGRSSLPRVAPEALHPALWLGHQLARQADAPLASGHAALDAQLPGGGWPRRAVTELLLPHAGVGELRLLAPSLSAIQRSGRLVMLFDPPARLSAWALAQWGVDVEALLLINSHAGPADQRSRRDETAAEARLWALEQALKSGHVGAVVAWLPPRLRSERMRRLQLAAHSHDGPAFVFRETAAAERPSAAPLRLALRPAGADRLAVDILKRRGPPLEQPLTLALPPVLSATAQQRARRGLAPRPSEASAWPPALQPATFVNLG